MLPNGIELANFQSFGDPGGLLEDISRVNILVGPNNIGKSKMLRAIQRALLGKGPYWIDGADQNYELRVRRKLNEQELQSVFRPGWSGGDIPGRDEWDDFGKYCLDTEVEISVLGSKGNIKVKKVYPSYKGQWINESQANNIIENAVLKAAVSNLSFGISGSYLVQAERDINPEPYTDSIVLRPNGQGFAAAIANYFVSSSRDRSILDKISADINEISYPDYKFDEISARLIENREAWEVYLKSGSVFVPVSQCGSGLKTIIQLACLFNMEDMSGHKLFVFEELENSLHPHTQRRLLKYIDSKVGEGSIIAMSTHSPVILDYFQGCEGVSFYEVYKNGNSLDTKVRRVSAFNDRVGVLDSLGVRASDAMQTNFVIWVEGPSDRIYVREWLSIVSGGSLLEHEHYTIMFYGGKLLSHLTIDEGQQVEELIQLLKINKKCAILIDSDKKTENSKVSGTKRRIYQEAESHAVLRWTTAGREIENYISDKFWSTHFNIKISECGRYDKISEKLLGKKTPDGKVVGSKVDIAKFVELNAISSDYVLDCIEKAKRLAREISNANGIELDRL